MLFDYLSSIFPVFISVIISGFIFLGIYELGKYLVKVLLTFCSSEMKKVMSLPLGLSLVIFISGSISCFGLGYEKVMQTLAYILVMIGLIANLKNCYFFISSDNIRLKKVLSFSKSTFSTQIDFIPIFFLFLLYLTLSLLPQSNADSFSYHIPAALNILNTGSLPSYPEWFHGRLVGLGEAFLALGLSVGSEHLYSVCHFFLLVHMFQMIKLSYDGDGFKKVLKYLPFLCLFSSPVILKLYLSSKPQLIPLILSTTSFWIIFKFFKEPTNKKINDLFSIVVVSLFIMGVATQMKFNFLLSYCVLSLYFFLKIRKQMPSTYFVNFSILLMMVLIFILVSIPLTLFKWNFFGGNLFAVPFTLFNGDFPGYENFNAYLASYKDSSFLFPFSIIFPDRLGGITDVIGMTIIVFLFINKRILKVFSSELISIAVFFILLSFLANSDGRNFLEPFFWACLFMFSYPKDGFISGRVIKLCTVYFQLTSILMSCLVVSIFIVPLYKAVFSWSNQLKFYKDFAYGYDTFEQIDKSLPKGSVLLSDNTAIAWSPVKVWPFEWPQYVEKNNNEFYYKIVKNSKPTHILIRGNDASGNKSPKFQFLKSCLGDIIYKGKAKDSTRNPYNESFDNFHLFKLKNLSCLN